MSILTADGKLLTVDGKLATAKVAPTAPYTYTETETKIHADNAPEGTDHSAKVLLGEAE